METTLCSKYANGVRRWLGFDNGFFVDCVGNSGGLMLIWNEDFEVHVKS